jgi:flagellar basal body-associated protein FliL
MKFAGFVIFIIIASSAFFVLAAVSLIAPFALRKKEDEDEVNEEEIALD